MDTGGFNIWLCHFISIVKPTPEEQVLVLLDWHVSHTKNLEAILKACESGVIMLSLQPHKAHRLHPVDVVFSNLYRLTMARKARSGCGPMRAGALPPTTSVSYWALRTLEALRWQTLSMDSVNAASAHATGTPLTTNCN